jgi:membrane protease YdiL (CAAX protease family)
MLGSSTPQAPSEPINIIVFILFGLIINTVVYRHGFFKLPDNKTDHRYWSFYQCFACFSLYFVNALVITPFVFRTILSIEYSALQSMKIQIVLYQSINVLINIALLFFYLTFQKRAQIKSLWKDPSVETSSYFYDILMGIFTWFISFPVVVALNSLCEWINSTFFKFEEVDQVAVHFLKTSSSSTITLVITTMMIIITAPFIEEFLFRGCIQNFLRKRLGTFQAIVLTSFIFAMMHFSPSQKLSNIPLLISLFTFSLYLGFLYEKTRSLLAPIILHMTFNSISVIRILLS